MFKRIARYIANEMKKSEENPKEQTPMIDIENMKYEIQQLNTQCIDNKYDIISLKGRLEAISAFVEIIERSLLAKIEDVQVMIEPLNRRNTDALDFLQMVKELTYKINAYESWSKYAKMPVPIDDPLNMRDNPYERETSQAKEEHPQETS